MFKIGVQSQNAVSDDDPLEGFTAVKKAGFDCCDFSLNSYLKNTSIYKSELNDFFDRTVPELLSFFELHKFSALKAGITINQMHMPYPNFIPGASDSINKYLSETVAPKSMEICAFFRCPHIVVHGLKLKRFLGSEDEEWSETEKFLDTVAPYAKEHGIVICIENLYESVGGHIVEGPCCDARKAVHRIDSFNDRYGSEVLGFCYDTGHANLLGLNHYDFITTLGKRLKVLHIHDNDGVHDLHQIPFAFTRTRENTSCTDWESFIEGLKESQFNGVLSFETAPVLKSFPLEMKENVLEFIAQIGKYFERKIYNEI